VVSAKGAEWVRGFWGGVSPLQPPSLSGELRELPTGVRGSPGQKRIFGMLWVTEHFWQTEKMRV